MENDPRWKKFIFMTLVVIATVGILGLAGFYAISDFDRSTSELDTVPPQPPDTNPKFGDSGGVDFRAGYRPFSRWAFEFDYQWQAGYDSKRSSMR